MELKSQVGPSFGNNFNNRSEEALGIAVDAWTAFREGAYGQNPPPWLGYLFLLEDCPRSRNVVAVQEPHFPVFPDFRQSSYSRRYELLCRRLVAERHYNAACFLTADRERARGPENYAEPAVDLSGENFLTSMAAHVAAALQTLGRKA